MRYLIDTHAFLWFCQGSPKLSKAAREAIEEPSHEVFFSAASYWEICLKIAKGKLILSEDWREWITDKMTDQGFQWLAIDKRHCEATVGLVTVHGDPFDRMLLAQAKVEKLILITIDANLEDCGVPVLW
jgi:PIN domain nuclease of toxin-antitoxin system